MDINITIDFCGYSNDTTVGEIRDDLKNKRNVAVIEAKRGTKPGLTDCVLLPLINEDETAKTNYIKECAPWDKKKNKKKWQDGNDHNTLNSNWSGDIFNHRQGKGKKAKQKIDEFIKFLGLNENTTLEEYWRKLNDYPFWGHYSENNKSCIDPNAEELKKEVLKFFAPNSEQYIKKVNNSVILSQPEDNTIPDATAYAKNIVLYGPPGTGKTRKAKILAYELLTKDEKTESKTESEILEEVRKVIQGTASDNYKGRIKLVQFHPSYSYNDFMESIEFSGGCCDYKDKIFKDFASDAKKAAEKAKESGNTAPAYVLIIDEINRANVSNVLGELLYGLEYREQEFSTAVKGDKFSVPENLYIIGTMNTADRSLQNLDYAVRRRFSFEKVSAELPAAMETGKSGSDCYMVEGNKYFYKTIFEKVKGHVEASVARGVNAEDILPGISYFLVEGTKPEDRKDHLTYKIKYELIPLLKEYAKDGMFTKRKKIVGDKSLIDVLKDKEYEELLLK